METHEEITPQEKREFRKVWGLGLLGNAVFKSYSVWLLLISNILIALFAIIENQNVLNILWVYWFQSVIIGVFNFFKIISLKNFTVDGLKMNNKLLAKSSSAKYGVAIFFLFHYGFFHFVYATFLFTFFSLGDISSNKIDTNFILITSLIFFVNYLVEYVFSFKKEQSESHSLPKLMMSPYKRIIPMHLTIILSGFVLAFGSIGLSNPNISIIIIFMALKTFIDMLTHS